MIGFVFVPLFFLLASLRDLNVVLQMRSFLVLRPDVAPLSVRLAVLLMHKLMAGGASHLVFLSPDCASSFRGDVHLDQEEYSVLSHGVKTDVPKGGSPAAVREEFGYDPDDDIVAIPGFIRPPKGHDIFLEVARELPEYEFMIAGGARPKGEDFEFYQRIKADAPDNVTITGVLDEDEFWKALAVPDLALLPYRVVSQSGTFNCCASQDLPILASNAQYFQQIAAEWGAPETVSLDDPADIATRVRTLLEDDERREKLAESMREYKRENCFERITTQHAQIYRSITDSRGPVEVLEPTMSSERSVAAMRAACSAQRSAADD
jgi:glycosyltransferase involved in cell wall biosynthesis